MSSLAFNKTVQEAFNSWSLHNNVAWLLLHRVPDLVIIKEASLTLIALATFWSYYLTVFVTSLHTYQFLQRRMCGENVAPQQNPEQHGFLEPAVVKYHSTVVTSTTPVISAYYNVSTVKYRIVCLYKWIILLCIWLDNKDEFWLHCLGSGGGTC